MKRREIIKYSFVAFGYTITAGGMSEILSGCKSKTSGDWEPNVFSDKEFQFLSEFAETILPRTKSPGAKDAHVDRFIDQFLFKVGTDGSRKSFKENLNKLDAECKALTGKHFVDCKEQERKQFIEQQEALPYETIPNVWGFNVRAQTIPTPFYRDLKGFIIRAFYGSELISKKMLRFDPVPGKFQADIPLSESPVMGYEG